MTNFHIMTLFPEMVEAGLKASIIGRAEAAGIISINIYNIRDYTDDPHGSVDDYPYGGGAGMVLKAQPVFDCYRHVLEAVKETAKPVVIYTSPAGKVFNQTMAKELSKAEDIIILCGHYEGVDERALELIGSTDVSIGDYVLTGGEIPAMAMVDAVSRMVPGVLTNADSKNEESFEEGLLEYPQYTRPSEYMGLGVPEILLSGDHAKVDEWRREQARQRTKERRPDLL